jgi:hypothetical protein
VQINNDSAKTVDTVFPAADKVDESQIGNREHENNPAFPFADTRTVPSFKLVEAKVEKLPSTIGDGYGLKVKGELNSDGLPADVVSAVKNSIRNGYLHSMSVEFVAKKVRDVFENGTVVRVIEKALQKGAALTARPMNPTAKLTDAIVKSEYVDYIDETQESKNNITGGNMPEEQETQENKNEEAPETDEQPSQEETQDEVKNEDADQVDEPAEEDNEEVDEGKSMRDEVDEIKSMVSNVKEENEELKQENEELKSQIEDLKEFKSLNDSLDEIKSSLADIGLENGPKTGTEQNRFESEQETKADWKQTIDSMGMTADYLEAKSKTGVRNVDAFVEGKNVSADEVLEYVK